MSTGKRQYHQSFGRGDELREVTARRYGADHNGALTLLMIDPQFKSQLHSNEWTASDATRCSRMLPHSRIRSATRLPGQLQTPDVAFTSDFDAARNMLFACEL